MTISSNGMGNTFRLQSLKNVNRRKVLPGAEFLELLEPPQQDLGGTAAPYVQPEPNLPEPEMGGELTPQSYDIRANQVVNPELERVREEARQYRDFTGQANEENALTRLGRSLALQSQEQGTLSEAPPIETQQTQEAEGLPPVSAVQEEQYPAEPRSWSRVGENLRSSFTNRVTPNPEIVNQIPPTDLLSPPPILYPLTGESNAGLIRQNDPEFQAQIQQAEQDPNGMPVYGATDYITQYPEIVADVREYTGVDLNSPEAQALTKSYEAILTGQDNELVRAQGLNDEQINAIRQRIDTNTATDMDKFYIGLAITLPLIVGGLFGAEAGLGALGGGAKGFADILERRGENVRADEEALTGLNKQRAELGTQQGELALQRAQLPETVRKSAPGSERDFLRGTKEVTITDPETGEQLTGTEILPGLVAKPEFLNTEKDKERLANSAEKLNVSRQFTEDALDLTDKLAEILPQIKDVSNFRKRWKDLISNDPSYKLKDFPEEVMFEGRKQRAAPLIQSLIAPFQAKLAQAEGLGQLDAAAMRFMPNILANPFSSYGTAQDTVNQITNIRNQLMSSFVKDVNNRGFYPQPFLSEFGRRNRAAFEPLNRKERKKQSAKDVANQ